MVGGLDIYFRKYYGKLSICSLEHMLYFPFFQIHSIFQRRQKASKGVGPYQIFFRFSSPPTPMNYKQIKNGVEGFQNFFLFEYKRKKNV